jgi:uncharacterized protein YlaI
MVMKEHRFLNKIDFNEHPSAIPNTDAGNLKLYRMFSLVRDSFDIKSRDDAVGFPDSLEKHALFYQSLVATMEGRGLTVPRSEKSGIERMLSLNMKVEKITEPITIYHCPNCGNKLAKTDIETYICGECHGRLPGYSEYVMQKPFHGFKNWDDCMTHMRNQGHDEESAKNICGKLQTTGE